MSCARGRGLDVTRAVTVAAGPEDIWPWLAQWGWNRAGFCSYGRLDNLGRPSARQILPQFQHLTVGDWVPMGAKTTPPPPTGSPGSDLAH
jgi:hypothetical protein